MSDLTDLERDLMIKIKDWSVFWQAVDGLNERRIFELRYSRQGQRNLSYDQIALMLGMTKDKVRQDLAKAFRLLRNPQKNMAWVERKLSQDEALR
ncbi:MAG: hypothetical protein D6814_00775 [Calditrichaeota bacterium]|nr:MAG: hypothetical protein D6814_00775 [Calditrichota bacterium]